MGKFSFEHLSDTEFEEYCFDLIKELDFSNVDWRKGTGKATSPSDNGRDIEAEKITKDFDGETITEKWFFECKHHTRGVSPEKIQSALSWATAERPNKLVIICSNFLSNPCKEYLKKYNLANKPNFNIRSWELKQLEELSLGKIKLLNKYQLSDGLDFLERMHPLHIKYSSEPHASTLKYFFSVLDTYEKNKREKVIEFAYTFFIKPKYDKSNIGNENMSEPEIDEANYNFFKERCYEMSKTISEFFIVKSLVNLMLEWTFYRGDETKQDIGIKFCQVQLSTMKKELRCIRKGLGTGEYDKASLKKSIKITEDEIEKFPAKTRQNYSLYINFCENVLSRLIEGSILENVMGLIKNS